MSYGHYACDHPPINHFCFRVTNLGGVTTLTGVPPRVGTEVSRGVLDDQDPTLAIQTVSSDTATTITVAGTPWTASAYIGQVAVITSGPNAGRTGIITANTNNTLTFSTNYITNNGGLATPTFEIRKPSCWLPVVTAIKVQDNTTTQTLKLQYTNSSGTLVDTADLGLVTAATATPAFWSGLQVPGDPSRGGSDIVLDLTAALGAADDIVLLGYYMGYQGAMLPNSP